MKKHFCSAQNMIQWSRLVTVNKLSLMEWWRHSRDKAQPWGSVNISLAISIHPWLFLQSLSPALSLYIISLLSTAAWPKFLPLSTQLPFLLLLVLLSVSFSSYFQFPLFLPPINLLSGSGVWAQCLYLSCNQRGTVALLRSAKTLTVVCTRGLFPCHQLLQ
jgi:hypothetical protein